MKNYFVYFLTSETDKVMYVGITSNLERRLYEHRSGQIDGFTKKYKVHKLVYFETFNDPKNAILREKQIKRWRRDKKDFLVNITNPEWRDLSGDWLEMDPSASLGMT